MKKFTLLFCAIVASVLLNAQSLSPVVIASAGGFASNSNNSLSYTIGEMSMVQTFSSSNTILTQGFQQPNESITGLLDVASNDFGSFVVYPNPAVNDAWIGFQLNGPGKVTVLLYNELGQKLASVYHAEYTNGKIVQPVNVSSLSSGAYFLSMIYTCDKDGKDYNISKQLQVIK